MFSSTQVLALSLGLVAAVCHLFAAAIGLFLERASKELSRLVGATFLVSAWYSFWVGIRHAGFFDESPNLTAMPMVLAGYLGPLLYLLTRKLLDPFGPLDRRNYWALLLGLPGTFLFFYLLQSDEVAAILIAGQTGELFAHPVPSLAFLLNAVEIVLCILASIFVIARAHARAEAGSGQRHRARWAFGPIAGALLAVIVSNVLPVMGLGFKASIFGPILTLPMLVLALAAVRNAGQERQALEDQRRAMSRYLPRQIVDQIVVGRHRLSLGGDLTVATILISDIRDFTRISEQLSPEEVVAGLNRYLSTMTEVVFRHGGMVDKFIGDSILAVFGVPEGDGTDATRALECAQDMLAALERFNGGWTADGHAPLAIGIGVHRGPVLSGNVGSENRMDFTVIGDTVNTASRVEALTKVLGAPVLLTSEVARSVEEGSLLLEPAGDHVLRGRSGKTALLSLTLPAG